MGNWRTVNVIGTMSERDATALRGYLGYTYESGDPGMEHFGPLSFNCEQPSLCGLNVWPAPEMNRAGNLAERDYSVEDVADELRNLLSVAPSMLLKVHCGGDWESDECVATVSVGEGLVVIGKPEVERIAGISDEQAIGNLLANLTRPL